MTYREVVKKLIALGCVEVARTGDGSHRKWHNPATRVSTSVPDWAGKDLKPGTIRGAVRKLGLGWDEFSRA